MTKEYVEVDIGNLPEKAQAAARRSGCVDVNENVWMDAPLSEGGLILYSRDKKNGEHDSGSLDGWLHPTVILMYGGKVPYVLEDTPAKSQDASDLEYHQEIIIAARAGEKKDKQTCEAIGVIQDQFIIFLACLNYISSGSDAQIRARRGRIQRARLTAVRIWTAGQPKKEPEKIVEPEKQAEKVEVENGKG